MTDGEREMENMITLQRHPNNPILKPNLANSWEYAGAFNSCVVYVDGIYHMVYRALSSPMQQNGVTMQVSSIGYATSKDGITFGDHRLLFSPTEEWEMYGCEDPRITYMDGRFYIFYTALSVYPFSAYGIKVALAITSDFQSFDKHPVTTFDSKAMGLFPEKINGKMAALLTINTDLPPAKIAFASFDKPEDITSPYYWADWYGNLNENTIHLLRDIRDQVELGAPPIKTKDGWLVIYSYIKDYMSANKSFGIEAVLLDLDDPRKILGRTESPLLTPEKEYELTGNVPSIIFPSGALTVKDELFIYYGAADTRSALASCDLNTLLDQLKEEKPPAPTPRPANQATTFTRFAGNPIITPVVELEWETLGTFNPAAIYLDGKVHIIYRAQGRDGTSVLGYASSTDGLHIDEKLDYPIYVPREDFEKKTSDTGNSGCEDPRITQIGNRLYMTYTAYDGRTSPRVAMTSITVENFLKKNWNWEKPRLISPPGVDDKDACIMERVNGKGYVAFHRLGDVIWLDFLRDLAFPEEKFLSGGIMAQARKDKWDNVKIGISSPPLPTEHGWLLLYHGVSNPGAFYKVGAMLLDYADPRIVLSRTDKPIFEPEMSYELEGQVPNVVFPCGAVIIDGTIFMYYGGADSVVGVATMPLQALLDLLIEK